MIRVLPSLAAAFIAAVIPAASNDALQFWQTNYAAPAEKFRPAKEPLDIRPVRKIDPALQRLADQTADRFGVPRSEVRFIIMRESGWNPFAKNPRSTATGLTQPVIGSHAAIIGKPLTREEHRALSVDPQHNLNVGVAHMAACYQAQPNWTAERRWRKCHVEGHKAAGTSIEAARAAYARVVEGRAFPFMVSAYAPPQGTFGVAMLPASFVPGNEGRAR